MAGDNTEWTSEQMIENATNWSLAGDVAVLNRLKTFSKYLLSETISVSENVDGLLNNLENVSLKLDLTKNEFQSLRNTHFIENRVYEDDETLENNETKVEEKELTEDKKEAIIKESIMKGLEVMKKYYEKVEVAVSDSEEEENEKSYILKSKDPYIDRPLPYLVGTEQWYKKWHVGLLPSESESESEKEEEVYSSSDSEELLPKNRNLGSETSSELDFNNRDTGPVANSTFNDSQDRRKEIFHSSDESSEPSNSLSVKTPLSNEKFAEQLAAKLGNVISGINENAEPVNRNPIKRINQPTQYGNLFSDEPPPLDDLEDTMLPKSAHQGLFSGGRDLFAADNDDDLFWGQQNKPNQLLKSSEEEKSVYNKPDLKSKPKVSKGLFDQSDSSSEDDMFTVAEKRKVKTVQSYLQPVKTTMPYIDDQPPDITSKSDSGPSKKKPIGGVSIFGENTNIFRNNSAKPGFENTKSHAASQETEETYSKSIESTKNSLKKRSLFDESSTEDDLSVNANMVSKKPENQQSNKKLSLFDDDNDDFMPPKGQNTLKKPEDRKKLSLFDEDDDILPPKTEQAPRRLVKHKKLSLFDDDDDIENEAEVPKKEDIKPNKEEKIKKLNLFHEDTYQNADLYKPTTQEVTNKTEAVDTKKPVKKISLFDDDDDFLKEEEDIFANVPKRKSLFDDIEEKSVEKPSKGLFEDIEDSRVPANEKSPKKPLKRLSNDSKPSETVAEASRVEQKKKDGDKPILEEDKFKKKTAKGLFEDLESSGGTDDLSSQSRSSKIEDNPRIFAESSQTESHDNKKVTEKESESSRILEHVEKKEETNKLDENIGNKSSKGLFDDLENSGSSEDLFGGSKRQVMDTRASKGTENLGTSLFRDITSTTALFEEHKKEDVDVKISENSGNVSKDTTKNLDGDQINIDFEGFKGPEGEKQDRKIKTGIIGSGKPTVKPRVKQASLKDANNDDGSFGESNNQDEVKENLGVLRGTRTEDIEKNNVQEESLGIIKGENIKTEESSDQGDPERNINSDSRGVLKQDKTVFLGTVRKTVGFLASDSEGSSDESFSFIGNSERDKIDTIPHDKNTQYEVKHKDSKESTVLTTERSEGIAAEINQSLTEEFGPEIKYTHSPPKHKEPRDANTSNYTIPPPIDLFDPNPPPPDPNWDNASDNSGESDTFSLTDGILDRANFTQSQASSSLFDEAPPSLDVNESSGIVRDMNVTRVETDESSFYPYASSSRRLSSDVFGEQQCQDSFFVTKNRTEVSTQPGSNLGKIPENNEKISKNLDNVSSKIDNLTPSGNIEDFEGSSSVFERSHGPQDSSNTSTASISEIKKPQTTSLFGEEIEDTGKDIFAPKMPINVRQSASLFERNTPVEKEEDNSRKTDSSPPKSSPGRLKHNLNINVGALMPGAARPKSHTGVVKSQSVDETDKSPSSNPPLWGATSLAPSLVSRVARSKSEIFGEKDVAVARGDERTENVEQTGVLQSATKDRVRIPVKRRPSTRKARHEAVRKSMTDFSLYVNEEGSSIDKEEASENDKIAPDPSNTNKNSFLKDLSSKLKIPDGIGKDETSRDVEDSVDSPEEKRISLVFEKDDNKQPEQEREIAEKPASKDNSKQPEKDEKIVTGSKELFDSFTQDTEDLFKLKPEIGEFVSGDKQDEEDIFKNILSGTSNQSNNEHKLDVASRSTELSEKEEAKPEAKGLFDESLEDDSNIFKSLSKPIMICSDVSEKPKQEVDLFGSVGPDSSDEDLFSSSKKSFKKDICSSSKPSHLEETSNLKEPETVLSQKESKPSIFSDKSESEDEGDLFGNKSKVSVGKIEKKILGEKSKKANLFGDSEDSSEEDLFGAKTTKSGSGSGDSSENTGSTVNTRRVERNIKVATVKKLENKEVTDFDPLSALK